ncbi:hypothetical protein RUND412_004202 [Rhizina undulata]
MMKNLLDFFTHLRNRRLSNLDADLKTAQRRLEVAEQSKATYKSYFLRCNTKVHTLESQLKVLTAELVNLRLKANNKPRALPDPAKPNRLQKRLTKTDKSRRKADAKTRLSRSLARKLSIENEALAASNAELKATYTELKVTNTELTSRLSSLTTENENLSKEVADFRETNTRLENEQSILTEEFRKAHVEREASRTNNALLTQKIKKLEQEVLRYRDIPFELEEALDEFRQECIELRTRNMLLNKEKDNLEKLTGKLRTELVKQQKANLSWKNFAQRHGKVPSLGAQSPENGKREEEMVEELPEGKPEGTGIGTAL